MIPQQVQEAIERTKRTAKIGAALSDLVLEVTDCAPTRRKPLADRLRALADQLEAS